MEQQQCLPRMFYPGVNIPVQSFLHLRNGRPNLTKNVRSNPAATCLDHAALLAITPADPIPALRFAT